MNWPEAFLYSVITICAAGVISGVLNRASRTNHIRQSEKAIRDFLKDPNRPSTTSDSSPRYGQSPPLGQDPDDFT